MGEIFDWLIRQRDLPADFDAVIFDLDGTLIDSEPVYLKANLAFMASHGIQLTEKDYGRFVGIGARSFLDILRDEYGLTKNQDLLMAEMDHFYHLSATNGIPFFEPTCDFARLLKEAKIPIGIATGSTHQAIIQSLKWAELDGVFETVVSVNEVAKGKPAPDVFYETAKRMKVTSSRCLVLEDSRYGVEAGLAAGMTVMALTPLRNISVYSSQPDKDYSLAHLLVEGGPEHMNAKEFMGMFFSSYIGHV